MRVMGTDPSPGMLEQARTIASQGSEPSNVEFRQASAEDLSFLDNESVDMVVSGQAAHWFDYPKFFPEMKRILRRGGTLALWGYKDHVFVDYPEATQILDRYAYGKGNSYLGDYWSQPGRSIAQSKYQDIKIPKDDFVDIQRIEYEPGCKGRNSGSGTLFLEKRIRLADCMNYIRTWSAYHGWLENHPDCQKRETGGKGDVIDAMFDEIRESRLEWQEDEHWAETEVDIEWGSGLVLARRK